jgi:hypothetical protein
MASFPKKAAALLLAALLLLSHVLATHESMGEFHDGVLVRDTASGVGHKLVSSGVASRQLWYVGSTAEGTGVIAGVTVGVTAGVLERESRWEPCMERGSTSRVRSSDTL